jgi:O-antigen ligase
LGSLVVLALVQHARRRVFLPLSLVILGVIIGVNLPTKLAWKDEQPFRSSALRLFDISSGSGAFRADQYRATLGIVREHPLLGAGPGQWRKAMSAAKADEKLYTNPMPSSDYLRYFADGGFPALGLFLALGACFIRCAWRLRAEHPQVLASLLACATIALADPPLFRIELTILVCVIVASMVNQPQRLTTA